MRWFTGRILSGLAGLGLLAVSFIFTPATLPPIQLCYFNHLTGLPCPGCGLTRSVCSISHGQWAEAWHYNPFGFVAYAVFLGLMIHPLFTRLAPELDQRIRAHPLYRWLPQLIAVSLVLFGIARLAIILLSSKSMPPLLHHISL